MQSISDLINVPGFINLDFADVTSVMKDAGYAHMGVGSATGNDKAEAAARAAIFSPLLESSISGAHGILISISVSPDVGLEEVNQASEMIAAEAHPDASIIWGVAFDPELDDEMKITIIATGFAENRDNVLPTEAPSVKEKPEVKAAPATASKVAPAAQPEVAPTVEEEDSEDLDMETVLGMFRANNGRGSTQRNR